MTRGLTLLLVTLVLAGPAVAAQRTPKPAQERRVGVLVRAHRMRLDKAAAIEAIKRRYLGIVDAAERVPGVVGGRERGGFVRTVGQLPDKYVAELRDFAKHPYPSVTDNTAIQNHQLRVLRDVIQGDPALSSTEHLERARSLEAAAIDKLDRQFVDNRRRFKQALAAKSAQALRDDARQLADGLHYFVGGAEIRREQVAHGEIDGAASGSMEASFLRSAMGVSLGAGGISFGRDEAHGAASGSFQASVHGSFEVHALLPQAAQYRVRVADEQAAREGWIQRGDKTKIEARRIAEMALRLSDTLAALAERAPELAPQLHEWARLSQIQFELARPQAGADVRRVGVGSARVDLVGLRDLGVISPTVTQALRGEVEQTVPDDLR